MSGLSLERLLARSELLAEMASRLWANDPANRVLDPGRPVYGGADIRYVLRAVNEFLAAQGVIFLVVEGEAEYEHLVQ